MSMIGRQPARAAMTADDIGNNTIDSNKIINSSIVAADIGALDASVMTGIMPVGVTGGSGLNAVSPANLASGVMPVGVTGGSGLDAVPTPAIPAGQIIQSITNYNVSSLGSSSGTQVSFGNSSAAAAITITSGNHVLVTMAVNVYSGGNYGGYVWMCRGIGPGNSSSDMARSTFHTHIDCMTYVSGMSASDPHWYNTSGGHSYGHFTYQLLDTQLARHTTPTQPRYSLGLGGHPSGPSITVGGGWSYPTTWTLQEIKT